MEQSGDTTTAQPSDVAYICDVHTGGCGRELKTGTKDTTEAYAVFSGEGWKRVGHEGQWLHRCQDCFETKGLAGMGKYTH